MTQTLAISLFTLTFVIHIQAFGLNKIKWKSSDKGLYFTILHDEAGKYFFDSYLIRPGHLQEKLDSIQFDEQELALEHFNEQTLHFSNKKPIFTERQSTWTESASQQIWQTEEEWNIEWEEKYRDWVTREVTPDYLYKHNVAVDCANVPVSLRWIFARIHGLPAANQLAGSGVVFSNESFRSSWGDLPTHKDWFQDPLFLTALDYVLDHTYTHSLMGDLYPVEINDQFITAGAIFLNLYNTRTGHTELIRNIIFNTEHPTPIRTIAATVPRDVRILPEYGFRKWQGELTEEKHGFFRFRWPVLRGERIVLLEKERMPGHSLEQFSSSFTSGYRDYLHALTDRIIPGWTPNLRRQMQDLVSLILERFHARVEVVEKGHEFCSRNPGGCQPGTLEWEAWSTPSRDSFIASAQIDIDTLYSDSQCTNSCRRELTSRRNEAIIQFGFRVIRLKNAMKIWRDGSYSSDPNHSIRNRWGR